MGRKAPQPIELRFERETRKIAIADITPLRLVTETIRKTKKFEQIRSSIQQAGLVEHPVVAHDRSDPRKYLLLDGHLRLAILQDMDVAEVTCIIATDDEAYTYNKRVNRLAIIQEHRMILNAIERGVSEEVLAKVLDVNISNIRTKRRLLAGICPEAVELLQDKHVPVDTFRELRKMKPLRQIESAQLMVAMNKYSTTYARSLVGATPPPLLVDSANPKKINGLSNEQIALMEQESAKLDREFRLLEETYGDDHLDLVIATGYVKRLVDNVRVVRYMAQHFPELLMEFQKIAEDGEAAGSRR